MKATLILSKIKVHDRNAAMSASTADFEDMANSLEAVMTLATLLGIVDGMELTGNWFNTKSDPAAESSWALSEWQLLQPLLELLKAAILIEDRVASTDVTSILAGLSEESPLLGLYPELQKLGLKLTTSCRKAYSNAKASADMLYTVIAGDETFSD